MPFLTITSGSQKQTLDRHTLKDNMREPSYRPADDQELPTSACTFPRSHVIHASLATTPEQTYVSLCVCIRNFGAYVTRSGEKERDKLIRYVGKGEEAAGEERGRAGEREQRGTAETGSNTSRFNEERSAM